MAALPLDSGASQETNCSLSTGKIVQQASNFGNALGFFCRKEASCAAHQELEGNACLMFT
jgi:hypothetical protein